MSKNEFDELLLKKLSETELAYNPASWDTLAQLLPSGAAAAGHHAFDELLSQKLREEELAYDPRHWEQMAKMLPAAPVAAHGNIVPFAGRNRKRAVAAGIAAALVLLVGTTIFLHQLNKPAALSPEEQSWVQQKPAVPQPQSNTPPAKGSPAPIPGQPAPVQTAANPNTIQQKGLFPAQQPGPGNNQHNLPNNTPAPLQHENDITQPPLEIARQNPVQPEIKARKEHPAEERLPTPVRRNDLPDRYAYNRNNDAFYEGKENQNKNAKTSVSFGGGVNYGNLNTGYSAGVSVRRKMAGDFFVDGSVAMMYNNNATNVAINNGPSLNGNTASRPAAFNESSLASPALDPIQKLYYVQFNPSIGYQIEKHVALSVGGDFQQMLNRKEEIVQPENSNSRVFPNFDVGLTTKSEFSITPNIQAGLVYREGLNNLIKNEGSKYVNRRYVQVQFKYNIPVN